MSTAAQEEFDRLFNYKEKLRGHPEDRDNSDESSSHSDADDGQNDHYAHSDDDSDDEDNTYHTKSNKMVSRTAYTVPSTVFEANTGPKGVIADAQSFERARKRSFRRTLLSVAGLDSYSKTSKADSRPHKDSADNDVDEEEFMRRWRETRLQELQQRQNRPNPSKRVYGRVDRVDGTGYLNAIERAPSDTVVVVCIYDPESALSAQVEDSLIEIAQKQNTTRFVKLHHEIAEMDHIDAPALLAYKGGEVFATIVDIPRQLPRGSEIDATSIEDLLQRHGVF